MRDVRSVAEELGTSGYVIRPGFVAAGEWEAIAAAARVRWEEGEFRRGRVFAGTARVERPEIRSDWVHWIEPAAPPVETEAWMRRVEELRRNLNERFQLGLFEFEGFLAVYPPGAFYRRHLDRRAGTRHRIVSLILYLNEDWTAADGGELRLRLGEEEDAPEVLVLPAGGTFVAFLSERFPHEVRPATRERLSLTGWLRLRA